MLSCKQTAYIQDRVYNRQFAYPRAKNVNELLKTVEEQFGRSSLAVSLAKISSTWKMA